MFIFSKLKTQIRVLCILFLVHSFCALFLFSQESSAAIQPDKSADHDTGTEKTLDSSKYITIDEIEPGMQAYCLTVYEGTKIEKFPLDVLSVIRNMLPSRDAILVKGTDERFIHTGPVAGCSGSPVYIDGRLAGAIAFAWTFSKDPLYGVTPIEEMLRVRQLTPEMANNNETPAEPGLALDYSTPIDFRQVRKLLSEPRLSSQKLRSSAVTLPCPLVISGLPATVCEQAASSLESFGFMVIAGIGTGTASAWGPDHRDKNVQLIPGACLVVPLVTGDITMNVIGTVTEVQGEKVYGFGHSFLGHGALNLPMATGKVHTVSSNLTQSFKLASAIETVGALIMDESTAVLGKIGEKAKMIPLNITVDRYNDTVERNYNCRIVDNRLLTPRLLSTVVSGATLMLGQLPPHHTIDYKIKIGLENNKPIIFKNSSANNGPTEMIIESTAALALLMNNPYEKIRIESLDFDICVTPKNPISHIWSVNLSDTKVKAGDELEISVVIESFLEGKKEYPFHIEIPKQLKPGNYQLIISGRRDYETFLRQSSPHKFTSENLQTLIDALNNLLRIDRNKLHCILVLPPDGLILQRAEMPDLPATKALILQDPKRMFQVHPYIHWLEKSFNTRSIVIDKKTMSITVEK